MAYGVEFLPTQTCRARERNLHDGEAVPVFFSVTHYLVLSTGTDSGRIPEAWRSGAGRVRGFDAGCGLSQITQGPTSSKF